MLMGRMMKLADLFLNKGLSIFDIVRLITYILIPFFVYIVPMSLLLTILLSLGRLSSDGEIIAMKSSGISLYQIAIPIGLFASLASFLTLILTLYAYPWGFKNLRNLAFEIAKNQLEVGIQERVFSDEFEGMVIYVDKVSVKGGMMRGLFITDKRDPLISTTIVAKEGYISSDPKSMVISLRLFDGYFHRAGKDFQSYQIGNFSTYDINLDLKTALSEVKREKSDYREMSLLSLKEAIINTLKDNPKINALKVEYYKKFIIPSACFILVLIGIPLGIRKMRGGKSYGFIISIIILFSYYFLLITTESLGKNGKTSPFLIMWMPNILMGILGVYLFIKANQESPPFFLTWFNQCSKTLSPLSRKTFQKFINLFKK
jgi:lipopolysaccharide export system permease protein